MAVRDQPGALGELDQGRSGVEAADTSLCQGEVQEEQHDGRDPRDEPVRPIALELGLPAQPLTLEPPAQAGRRARAQSRRFPASGFVASSGSAGSASSGPLERTLFTAVLTGWTAMSEAGTGTSSLPRVPRSSFSGSSHSAHALGGSITGIRSWMSATFSFGWPVMMV